MFIKSFVLVNPIASLLTGRVPYRLLDRSFESLKPLSRSDGNGIKHSFDRLALQFEPNQGQADSLYQFVSRGNGYDLLLASGTAVLVPKNEQPSRVLHGFPGDRSVHRLTMKLVGASTNSRAVGEERLPSHVNYLIGNDPRRHHVGMAPRKRENWRATAWEIHPVTCDNYSKVKPSRISGEGSEPGPPTLLGK
jgi:hypothetical protein